MDNKIITVKNYFFLIIFGICLGSLFITLNTFIKIWIYGGIIYIEPNPFILFAEICIIIIGIIGIFFLIYDKIFGDN